MLALLAFVLVAQQVLVGNDIAPVMAARVVHAQQHLAEAGKAYEGDGRTSFGERSESLALARQFRDFSALSADETFEGWCETLYRPLFSAAWQTLGNPESGA